MHNQFIYCKHILSATTDLQKFSDEDKADYVGLEEADFVDEDEADDEDEDSLPGMCTIDRSFEFWQIQFMKNCKFYLWTEEDESIYDDDGNEGMQQIIFARKL